LRARRHFLSNVRLRHRPIKTYKERQTSFV
jgi:hypothetical protein